MEAVHLGFGTIRELIGKKEKHWIPVRRVSDLIRTTLFSGNLRRIWEVLSDEQCLFAWGFMY